MKVLKWVKVFAISLLILIVLTALALVVWSATSTYPAGETALAAMQSSQAVVVREEKWLVFEPEQAESLGLIFYPGGLVAPEAYAPVLHQIAAAGYRVILVPMPLNLAIFNANAAEDVMAAYPDISDWVLVGHSLGGAVAGIYAEENSSSLSGLVFWDSYPSDNDDLSDNAITVLSIYGSRNGVPNTDNFNSKLPLLPAEARLFAIEGASHAQFGDYGPQKGDVEPWISMAEQHQIILEQMLIFIGALQN